MLEFFNLIFVCLSGIAAEYKFLKSINTYSSLILLISVADLIISSACVYSHVHYPVTVSHLGFILILFFGL